MAVPAFADAVSIHLRDQQGEPHLALYHAASSELLAAVQDLLRKRTYRVAAPSRRVMRTGRSELHPRATDEWLRAQEADDEVLPLARKFGIPSAIFVPIIVGGRPVAVIVFTAAAPRIYNEHDLVFAEELARRASTAMHNAELFQTAKKERGRAEEAAALRERLVAIVGHDLRNPLASISMAAQMLSARALPANQDLVSRIQRSANRMMRMIAQILDFARIRTGQSFELRLESADLRQVCRDVIDELRLGRPEQEITLSIEGAADARIDPDRIAQVLSNLLSNAIQHGTGGPISVTVREATADAVAIDVHNVGPPIPKAAQAGIFEAFRRETTEGNHQLEHRAGPVHRQRDRARARRLDHRAVTRSRRDHVQRRPSSPICHRMEARWSPLHRSFIDARLTRATREPAARCPLTRRRRRRWPSPSGSQTPHRRSRGAAAGGRPTPGRRATAP